MRAYSVSGLISACDLYLIFDAVMTDDVTCIMDMTDEIMSHESPIYLCDVM